MLSVNHSLTYIARDVVGRETDNGTDDGPDSEWDASRRSIHSCCSGVNKGGWEPGSTPEVGCLVAIEGDARRYRGKLKRVVGCHADMH